MLCRSKLIEQATRCCFDVGGGSSNTDTRFQRTGTSKTQKTYPTLPSSLSGLIGQQAQSASIPDSLRTNEFGFLTSLMGRDPYRIPGASVLSSLQGLSPTSFTGG